MPAPNAISFDKLTRIIGGGGHFPWIENPAEVTAAFRDFADQVLGSPGG